MSWRRLWMFASLIAPLLLACTANKTPIPPSPSVPNVATYVEDGPIYTGPLYTRVDGYIEPGAHHARLFTIDDGVVDRATDIAVAGTPRLSHRFEVGRLSMFKGLAAYRQGGCVGMCVTVPLIDYEAGETYSVVADVMTGKVVSTTFNTNVRAPLGEQELRELFGTALTNPAIAGQVADGRYTVASAEKTFTSPGTSCSAEERPRHRCAIGFIYTPAASLIVFVDLTDRTLVDWQNNDVGGSPTTS